MGRLAVLFLAPPLPRGLLALALDFFVALAVLARRGRPGICSRRRDSRGCRVRDPGVPFGAERAGGVDLVVWGAPVLAALPVFLGPAGVRLFRQCVFCRPSRLLGGS